MWYATRFILMTFPPDRRGRTEPPVAYTDSLTGALYLTDAAEIQAYNEVWDAISGAALGEDMSRETISAQIERYQ